MNPLAAFVSGALVAFGFATAACAVSARIEIAQNTAADPVLSPDAVPNAPALSPEQMSAPPVLSPDAVRNDDALAPDQTNPEPARGTD